MILPLVPPGEAKEGDGGIALPQYSQENVQATGQMAVVNEQQDDITGPV